MRYSVIVLTYGQLHLTIDCLASVQRHTSDYEVIVVDNASGDSTPAYLKGLERNRAMPIRLVLNNTNRGFSGGNNQALRMAQGEYCIILNNDVTVTTGWADGLASALEPMPQLGIVCAATNLCGNAAMVRDAVYHYPDGLDAYAALHAQQYAGKLLPLPMAGFYCTMFRRSLVGEIGLLDEQFHPGYYEDDDYCIRAIRAGYRIGCAYGVFVHHAHQGTFRSVVPNVGGIVAQNRARFAAKWGLDLKQDFATGDFGYIDKAVNLSTLANGGLDALA